METLFPAVRLAALLLIGSIFTQSCTNDKEETASQPSSGIQLTNTSLGNVMTDETGRTLYFFSNDFAGASTCEGTCLTNWPIFTRDVATATFGSGLKAADFGTITRSDGTKQTTYKGWPLYYYKSDAAAGDVKGDNVGGVWFVAKPDYSIMIANAQLVGADGKSYTKEFKEGTGKTLFFTDGKGVALYGFSRDKKNKNNFTKSDLSNNPVWPLFEETLKEVPSTVNKTLFGSIDVFGRKQLTYNGWPLYYQQQDEFKRGSSKGVSIPNPGIWPIVSKDTPEAPAN